MDTMFDSESGLMLLATVAGAVFAFVRGMAWWRALSATRLQKALQCVQVGVELTYQEYVAGIKEGRADGTLTAEEKAKARSRAKRIAIDYGLKQGVDVVKELTHEYLDVAISQAVKRAKAGTAILGLLLCVGLVGCQTVTSEMTASGDSYSYKTQVTAGPFGKLDARAAQFSAGVDAEGAWHVDTGDNVQGVDNTGQIRALRETVGLIGTLAPLFARPAPVAEPEPTPMALEPVAP